MDNYILVISGPSGVGKTTVITELLNDKRFIRAVTTTTRLPRQNEQNFIDYNFIDIQQFNTLVDNDEFLEWAKVHNNYYGTTKYEVNKAQKSGICVLNIDVQGAATLRNTTNVFTIFLSPPSTDELIKRLKSRGSEPDSVIEKRVQIAYAELARQGEFDVVIVNDKVADTVEEIKKQYFSFVKEHVC